MHGHFNPLTYSIIYLILIFLYFARKKETKSQKTSPSFQPDDIIIPQEYPIALQGTPLLNVRLAVKSYNKVIPRGVLNHLLFEVAPEIQSQMGHDIAYIDRVEFVSGQVASVPPKASNSDEPDSATSHKYALIALGVLLGIVCLVAMVIIVLYYQKIKR